MKKFLISGYSSTHGFWGGIRSIVIEANSKEEAIEKARKKFGNNFGAPPTFTSAPRGIRAEEIEGEGKENN